MNNLIKNEIFKMKKDKSLKIGLIVTVALTVLTVLSNLLVNNMLKGTELPDMEMLGDLFFTSKYSISTFFSITNNFSFILPVFIAIFICKDFSYGTIRNKVIAGYSKTKIYLSTLISSYLVGGVLILINLIVTIILSMLLLEGDVEIVWLLKICALGILMYVEVLSMITFIAMCTKSQALTIVLSMVIMFLGVILVSVLELYDSTKWIGDLTFLKHSNILTAQGSEEIDSVYLLTTTRTIKVLLSSIGWIGLFGLLGIYGFNKKDIK